MPKTFPRPAAIPPTVQPATRFSMQFAMQLITPLITRSRRGSGQLPTAGFTVIEILVVMVMIGILSAIAAPGWQRFHTQRTVSAANERLYLAIREAQTRSLRTKSNWRASMRQGDRGIEWAVHRKDDVPSLWDGMQGDITIEDGTTFISSGGSYYIEFNERGRVNGRLGRVTVSSQDSPTIQRCTIASTLLGTIRRGKGHNESRDGHTCY